MFFHLSLQVKLGLKKNLCGSLGQDFYGMDALPGRDVTRLGLGGPSPPPPKDVAAPSNWNGNRSFFHGCFGHHAAVG